MCCSVAAWPGNLLALLTYNIWLETSCKYLIYNTIAVVRTAWAPAVGTSCNIHENFSYNHENENWTHFHSNIIYNGLFSFISFYLIVFFFFFPFFFYYTDSEVHWSWKWKHKIWWFSSMFFIRFMATKLYLISNPFPTQFCVWMTLTKTAVENIEEKVTSISSFPYSLFFKSQILSLWSQIVCCLWMQSVWTSLKFNHFLNKS